MFENHMRVTAKARVSGSCWTSHPYWADTEQVSEPTHQPEAELIERLRTEVRPELSVRNAARQAKMSEGRWRQIIKGFKQESGGVHVPVRAPGRTLARMADTVGATPDQLRGVGRQDAADELERILTLRGGIPGTPRALDFPVAPIDPAPGPTPTEQVASTVLQSMRRNNASLNINYYELVMVAADYLEDPQLMQGDEPEKLRQATRMALVAFLTELDPRDAPEGVRERALGMLPEREQRTAEALRSTFDWALEMIKFQGASVGNRGPQPQPSKDAPDDSAQRLDDLAARRIENFDKPK